MENFSKVLPSRSITEDFSREIPSSSRTIITNTAQNFPHVNNASNNANTNTGNAGTDWSCQVDYSTQQHAQTISPTHSQNTNHTHHKEPVTISEIQHIQPRILQLELRTLISNIGQLRENISALSEHVSGLSAPNESSNNTLENYLRKVDSLEDRTSKLFDRFTDKIDEPTQDIMEKIFLDASNLRDILNLLHPKCSTALVVPHINASLLKNVKIPRLNISKFVPLAFSVNAKKF